MYAGSGWYGLSRTNCAHLILLSMMPWWQSVVNEFIPLTMVNITDQNFF